MPHSKPMNNCNTYAEISHPTKAFFASLFAFAICALINSPTSAIPPTETIKLLAPDGAANDEFGNAVALSNLAGLSESNANIALVGVQFDSIGTGSTSFERGSVNVFTLNSSGVWVFETKLTASDGAANDHFGASVALLAAPQLLVPLTMMVL